MVLSLSVTAFAADSSIDTSKQVSALEGAPVLSQKQKARLNDWVIYDETTAQFLPVDGAEGALDKEEYSLLILCITTANKNLAKADFVSGEVSIVLPEQENFSSFQTQSSRAYSEGVTKIEFHWWGATIYLSKTTINYIGGGIAIGGIWVPEPIVSKILATLGVIGTLVPGGIAFDYNFILAGIGALLPGMSITFPAVTNVRWQ